MNNKTNKKQGSYWLEKKLYNQFTAYSKSTGISKGFLLKTLLEGLFEDLKIKG